MKKIDQLLSQISSQEILEVRVPKGTLKPTRSARAILEQAGQVVITQAVHKALTQARKNAGLQAKDVAKQLQISAARVAQIENQPRNLTLETLVQHAQAIGYEVEIVLHPRQKNLPEVRAELGGIHV